MYNNILVAVDGSDASLKAVDWAKRAVAELPQAKITFVHVFQPFIPAVAAGYPGAVMYQPLEMNKPEETPSYQAWDQIADKERVAYKNLVGASLGDEICKEAAEQGCDLIVLGSEGHGLVSSVLLGSVSAKVLHHAKCSVLVVR